MALNYADVAGFARKHGSVVIKPGKGAKLTVLKSGELDSNALIEAKSTRFLHKDEEYTSSEFEKLVRAEAND
jgi:hypothetical protein